MGDFIYKKELILALALGRCFLRGRGEGCRAVSGCLPAYSADRLWSNHAGDRVDKAAVRVKSLSDVLLDQEVFLCVELLVMSVIVRQQSSCWMVCPNWSIAVMTQQESLFTTTEAFVSRRALDACPHFVTRSREMSPLATSVSVIHVGRRTVVRRM